MVYVYRHRRLDDFSVFYIGIGNSIRRSLSKYMRNNYWVNLVDKYGYTVEIIAKCDTRDDACELEVFLIEEYGRKDLGNGRLCNMTDGGDGNNGIIRSEEEKDRLRILRKDAKFTDEHISKISKPVIQVSLEGNIIREHTSAQKVQNDLGIRHVNEVCRGRRKTAGGFFWEYKNKKDL